MAEHVADTHMDLNDRDLSMDAPQKRRQLKNFFVKPAHQVNFIGYFLTTGLAMITGVMVVIYMRMQEIDQILNSTKGIGVGGHIAVYDVFTDITGIATIGLFLFVALACAIALILSHRVAGPMIAILHYIEQIKQGNYDYERELRKSDELQPIHDALQDLARSLREQQR
ncbi:MAG: methyl-accepting chemotaxis protein [Pseudomonadota bacterium]